VGGLGVENQQDAASPLAGITNGNYSADYLYLANSALVEQINSRADGAARMNTVKPSDRLNRLTSSVSSPAGGAAQGFAYQKGFFNPWAVASG
jgi:hypothetical protein